MQHSICGFRLLTVIFYLFRYLPGPDDMLVLDIAYMIYIKFEEYPNALQIALFLDNMQVWLLIFIHNLISSLYAMGTTGESSK